MLGINQNPAEALKWCKLSRAKNYASDWRAWQTTRRDGLLVRGSQNISRSSRYYAEETDKQGDSREPEAPGRGLALEGCFQRGVKRHFGIDNGVYWINCSKKAFLRDLVGGRMKEKGTEVLGMKQAGSFSGAGCLDCGARPNAIPKLQAEEGSHACPMSEVSPRMRVSRVRLPARIDGYPMLHGNALQGRNIYITSQNTRP